MTLEQINALVSMGIRAATAAIELYLRASEAAQAGDEATALLRLAEARDRFSKAVAEWEAAGVPE